MSQKPETLFRKRVQKRLDAIPNSWWESIQQKTILGTPDIIGCLNGYFVALEIKADKNSPVTALQAHKLGGIMKANGMGVLVYPDNLDETIKLLKHLGDKNA